MTAVATCALSTLAAPASALTVTIPTLPAPLPPLLPPISGSVSGGTGGAPLDISVDVPGTATIDVEAPGFPILPALPIDPTNPPVPPVLGPPATLPVATPSVPSPVSPVPGTATPSPRDGSDPAVGLPNRESVAPVASAQPAANSARPPSVDQNRSDRSGPVSGAIVNRPDQSLLHRVPTIMADVGLWATLATVVFIMYLLVGLAISQRRARLH
jgi:fused signal recognition particle receptor